MLQRFPVHYFSYGSNLSRDSFAKKYIGFGEQPIKFERAKVAVLKDWTLSFNAYFCPPAEPVMASIERCPGSCVHGVIYEIADPDSWATLVQSEGGDGLYYDTVDVMVEVEGGGTILGTTFVIRPLFDLPTNLRSHVRPSQRYLGIILEGAQKENLTALVTRVRETKGARKPSFAMQTLGLFCGAWILYASNSKLKFTVWPHIFVGSRLYFAKEKLAEENSGSVAKAAAYYALSFAHFQLILVYCFASMCRLPFDADVRRKTFGVLKKMMNP